LEEKKKKFRISVQVTFTSIFFAFLALTVFLLNVIPTVNARDIVFSTKQNALLSQTAVMSSSLSALEILSREGVDQVMNLIDVGGFDRAAVVDTEGSVLYDSARTGVKETYGESKLLGRALKGKTAFSCRYSRSAFYSGAAMPVVCYGNIIGAVYLYELDEEQAAVIASVQTRLRSISIGIGLLTLAAVISASNAITRRMRALLKGLRIVREGNYAYHLPLKGRDEVRELSEEFNDMTERLRDTEELRRRFVSDASHELRTPLASIRLLADSVVQNENMDMATTREFVTDIGSEAERLQHLTEKLMRLTRMDSQAPAERVPVNMKKVAERSIHLLNPLAKKQNVTIYTDFAEDCLILASEDDIYQIIFNLAENAIKYNSFDGNVFLGLAREGESAVLTVEDTGIGIPEKDLPHIFGRFYRVDKARSRATGGSGLGLSIVHDAVLAHGGSIRAERRETVGTRFVVRFPLCREDGEKEGEA